MEFFEIEFDEDLVAVSPAYGRNVRLKKAKKPVETGGKDAYKKCSTTGPYQPMCVPPEEQKKNLK